MKKSILAILALPMIVASCSNQECEPIATGDHTMIVNARVANPTSRAGYSIDNLTEFALMVDNATAPTFNINTKIIHSAEGWNSYNGAPLLWDNGLNSVEVVAFAPYRDNVEMSTTDMAIEALADQSTEDAVLASDFLLMPLTSVTPTAANKNLDVVLGHKLAKLIINVKGAKAEINDLKINGLKLKGTLDLTTSEAPITLLEETAPILPFNNTGAYEAIVMPQGLNSDFTIAFKDGDEMYRWTYTGSGAIEGGRFYTINLEINKPDEVQLADDITVDNWNSSDESTYTKFEE